MPRTSYREHRATRARVPSASVIGSDADLDSLASFSTLASHTTLASIVGRPISPTPSRGSFSQYPGIESVSSSFTDSLGPAWGGVSGGGGGGGSAGRARRPSASPAPSSRLADRDAPAVSVGIQPPSPSSVRSQPHTPTLNPSRLSTNTPQIGLPPKKRRDPAERDEKRRKRERNAERWRRVRAREAAHDAPVRRWTKAAYSRYGTNGAMAAAVGGTLALRVMLTLTSLYLSPNVRRTLHYQIASARSACVQHPMQTMAPFCARTIGAPGTPFTTGSAIALIAGHLALEATLGWGAAVAWAVIEGWREGRTLRTRVAAVVYLILAPVLALSDGALLQMRTAPLGLMAWAILAACSGHDGAAAATIAASAWSDRAARVYAPAFVVYAIGKRVWLGPKGRGYLARLAVSATLILAVLCSLQPVPLRTRITDAFTAVRACLGFSAMLGCVKTVFTAISFKGILTLVAILPSSYLMLRASYVLRPAPSEPYTVQSVPATARMLPLTFTAVAAAICLPHADAALPLLPLSLASSLRGDDDEWAVAIQAHHVATMCLWPAFGRLVPLAAAYQLAWAWLIGARTDAPSPGLRAHQITTKIITRLALVVPLILRIPVPAFIASRLPSASGTLSMLLTAHRSFIYLSMALLVIWTNMRLVKTAWAIGAL